MVCKKCNAYTVDTMKGIGINTDNSKTIKLKHTKYITLCGPCRWFSFPTYLPRIQYQNFIEEYCKKYYPL